MARKELVLSGVPNWLEAPGVVLTAGHQTVLNPATHLLDERLAKVWRSGTTADTYLDIDLGQPREVGGLHLPNHDATPASRFRLLGDENPITGAAAFETPWKPLLLESQGLDIDQGVVHPQAALHLLDGEGNLAPQTFRHWRLELQGIHQAGGLYLGRAAAFERLDGFQVAVVDPSVGRRFAGGDPQTFERRRYLRATLPLFADVDEGLRDLLALYRRARRFGVAIYPSQAEAPALAFWAQQTPGERGLQHQGGRRVSNPDPRFISWNSTLVVEEV